MMILQSTTIFVESRETASLQNSPRWKFAVQSEQKNNFFILVERAEGKNQLVFINLLNFYFFVKTDVYFW